MAFGLLVACGGGSSGEAPKAGPAGGPAPQGPVASQKAQEKFNKAVEQLHAMEKEGKLDYGALKKAFQAAAREDSQFAQAHHNLGVIAEAEGKTDDAFKAYQAALHANPRFAPSAENLAGMLVAQGKVDDAIKVLEDVLKLEPKEPRPHVALANIFRDRKRYDEALEHCRAALQQEPKNILAFEAMATTYADQGNVPMSRLVGARGLKVDAKNPVIQHMMGRHLLAENKIPDAVNAFKMALESNPAFRPARIELAEVALTYRDFGNAKMHYTELLKENPNDIAVLIGIGVTSKGLGLADDAKAAYEKVLKLQPKHPAATLNLAMLYHRTLNDFAAALKIYKEYQQSPAPDGPKPEEIAANVNELEQTIEALKQAEQMEKQMQEQAATMQAQQPEQQPEQPPAQPQGAPPAGGG